MMWVIKVKGPAGDWYYAGMEKGYAAYNTCADYAIAYDTRDEALQACEKLRTTGNVRARVVHCVPAKYAYVFVRSTRTYNTPQDAPAMVLDDPDLVCVRVRVDAKGRIKSDKMK